MSLFLQSYNSLLSHVSTPSGMERGTKSYCKEIDRELWRRFKKIDKELNVLANDDDLMRRYAYDYSYANLFSKWDPCYWMEKATGCFSEGDPCRWKITHACGVTTNAIMKLNMHDGIFEKEVKFSELINELNDDKEGVFKINLGCINLVNDLGQMSRFIGHAFTIIKVIVNGKKGYRCAQSYFQEYHLSDFLNKKIGYFSGFTDLEKCIIAPLSYITEHFYENWNYEFCKKYEQISGVSIVELQNYRPNSYRENPIECYRTTDVEPPPEPLGKVELVKTIGKVAVFVFMLLTFSGLW